MKKYIIGLIASVLFFQSIALYSMDMVQREITKKRKRLASLEIEHNNAIKQKEKEMIIWQRMRDFDIENDIARSVYWALRFKTDEQIGDDEFVKKIIELKQEQEEEFEQNEEKAARCSRRKKACCTHTGCCLGGCVAGGIFFAALTALIFIVSQ